VVLRFEEKDGKFIEKDRLKWPKEGWGLGHNGSHLIITDGTDKIYITNSKL
jgi:glutamine cyclotransferase